MRRVTFSRNYTLSLSRTCQCYCKYCAFATHRAHIHSPEAVAAKLDEAERRNAKELLILTGERPEVNAEVAARLAEWGHEDFTSYVVWACERALERGILPHTNLGVLSKRGPRPAPRGDRFAGPDAGVDLRAADGDRPCRVADQAPGEAAGDDRSCRRAADPVHLAGSSSASARRRTSASNRWKRWRGPTSATVTCRRSSSRTSSRTRSTTAVRSGTSLIEAARDRWGEDGTPHPEQQLWRLRVRGPVLRSRAARRRSTRAAELGYRRGDRRDQAADPECKRLMPDVGIQIPPNLSDWWSELVAAGATDLGGLSANGDHISPEHAFPEPASGPQGAGAEGFRADRAALRLPAVHGPRLDGAGRPRRDQAQVLELHPAARLRAAGRREHRSGARRAGDRQGSRGGGAERGRADGALRRDPRRR